MNLVKLATSHDRFPPSGGLAKEIPLFQGKSRSVKYYIWFGQMNVECGHFLILFEVNLEIVEMTFFGSVETFAGFPG